MNCPYCGETVHDQAVLCVHCGKSLSMKAENSPNGMGITPALENAFGKLAVKIKTVLILLLIKGAISLISEVIYTVILFVGAIGSDFYGIYKVATDILSPISSIIYFICLVIAISGLSAFAIELKKHKKG